jgi:tetratricopeptide (TPR) repeat protein
MLTEHSGSEELPLPESIQGIVGARLDALALPEKQLLQNAAVIGKVFWPGAVAALGDRDDLQSLEVRLHALELKQFIRRERRSSVARETQYAFTHVVLRDVAYGQIPRGGRVEKHVLAAEWIESLGRPEDHAEMRAHHYSNALELALAANQDTAALTPRVRVALSDAGDRARALNAYDAAVRFYREALALWPLEPADERAGLLLRIAVSLYDAGDVAQGEALEEARSALVALGDRARAAKADSLLSAVWWQRGDRDRCFEHLERAHELIRDAPPSAEKAHVLSQVARYRMLAREVDEDAGREALQLAESLGLDEIRAQVLITIGTARSDASDIERGLEIAVAGNWLEPTIRGYSNLAAGLDATGYLREALRINLKAEEVALRRGGPTRRRWVHGNMLGQLLELGEWEQCAKGADEFLSESERLGPHYHDASAHCVRAFIRLARGDIDAALADQAAALISARLAKDPQVVYPTLALSIRVLAEAGRLEQANQLLDELIGPGPQPHDRWSSDLIWVPAVLGRREDIRPFLRTSGDGPWAAAARAVVDEDFRAAAATFDAMGAAVSAATARIHLARALLEAGHRAEAEQPLQEALTFFRSVDAKRFVREGEALLYGSGQSARTNP